VILDLLFPRRCLGCGREGGYFCASCINLVSLNNQDICPVCARPSIGGLTHDGCASPLALDGLTVVFNYRGLVKKAIKKLKYRFVSDLAQDLVEVFLSFCGENKAFSKFCQEEKVALVPIPLHPQRFRWRGFNQAELLGQLITRNLGLKFLPEVLVRTKKTLPQADLAKKDRQKNIKNAFSVFENCKLKIENWNFILFDDVWTSGATLKEAAKVLKRNGAEKVWGLTLAR